MTFLELCQMTAQQTGTIQGTLPTTVTGQVNRLKQVVDYVREAYQDIQNAHRGWRWLNSEFLGVATPGVSAGGTTLLTVGATKYVGTDFFDERTHAKITRFSQWGFKGDGSDMGLTVRPATVLTFINGAGEVFPGDLFYTSPDFSSGYFLIVNRQSGSWTASPYAAGYFVVDMVAGVARVGNFTVSGFFANSSITSVTATDEAGEGPLRWLDWDRFYETQTRGTPVPGRPQFYSISPDGNLIISPPPDIHYLLRGKYRKSFQTLAADADVPEMPVEFHTIIKDAALCYVEAFDEGPRIPVYRLRMLPNFSMLESHQLPHVNWGVPLA